MSETTALSRYSKQYLAKKALFSFMGNSFRLYDASGSLAFFVKQKAFKLKEDIVVYADEGQTQAMLRIKARSIMDTRGTYDVTDAATGEEVGALKREGLKSIFRDEWTLLDTDGSELGKVKEDSGLLALVRRFLIKIIPQTFRVTVGGAEAGLIKQRFNLFGLSYDVDFTPSTAELDPRMVVATTVLLLAIEGQQQ